MMQKPTSRVFILSIAAAVGTISWWAMQPKETSDSTAPDTGALTDEAVDHVEFDIPDISVDAGDALYEDIYTAHLAEKEALASAPTKRAASRAGSDAHIAGVWEETKNWPLIPMHASLLPDGRVLAYDTAYETNAAEQTVGAHDKTRVALWDPATDSITSNDMELGYNMFCSALSKDIDGDLVTVGGNANNSLSGINKTHLFDPESDTWYSQPSMSVARWYPAATALADGNLLITGGGPSTLEIRDNSGSIRALSASNTAWANRSQHPWLQLAPTGKVVYYGPHNHLISIDTSGSGSINRHGGRDGVTRGYGTTAMYDTGKMLVVGGGNRNTVLKVDINGSTPVVSNAASMSNRRTQANATVLADGKVLVIGGNNTGSLVSMGSSQKVMTPEIWDPVTDQWNQLADMAWTRQYHGTALLMPDGRVLSAGGGLCGSCASQGYHYKNSEVFMPPYLFKTDGSGEMISRPTIENAPEKLGYNRSFNLLHDSPRNIASVALLRPGSTTHSTNMEQRRVPLSFTQSSDTQLAINTPNNANIAPPGYYMLVLVDDAGVPSVARMVHVANQNNSSDSLQLSNPGYQRGKLGVFVSLTVGAHSTDQLNLSYSATNLPDGMQIDAETGRIYGIPSRETNFNVRLTVTDSTGRSREESFRWVVDAGTDPDPVTDGLVGHWPVFGTSTEDVQGSANGSLTNGAQLTFDTERNGEVLNFDGRDDYFVVPFELSTQASTVSFWFKTDSKNQGMFMAFNYDGGHDRVIMQRSDDLSTRIYDESAQTGGRSAYDDGQWHHLVYTHGSDVGGNRLFIDGEQVVSGDRATSLFDWQTHLAFGYTRDNPGSYYFEGQIDDIRVFNRALSTSEVGRVYMEDTLTSANQSPLLSDLSNQSNNTGDSVSVQLSAWDGDGDSLTWQANQLPNGLSIDNNGLISGTPSSNGTFNTTVTVRDPAGASDSIQFSWVIQTVTVELSTPVVANSPAPAVLMGSSVSYSASATGTDVQYRWSFADTGTSSWQNSGNTTHQWATAGRYLVTVEAKDSSGTITRTEFVQQVYSATTDEKPVNSGTLLMDTDTNRVWVANPDNDTVSVIDATTRNKLAEIAVGAKPSALTLASGGDIWVSNKVDASLSVIDADTFTVTRTIALPAGSQPHGIVGASDSASVYVATAFPGELLKLNAANGQIQARTTIGENLRHVSIDAARDTVYATRFVTPSISGEDGATPDASNSGGIVAVLDADTLATRRTVLLPLSTVNDSERSGGGLPNYLGSVAIAPDNGSAWVPSKQDNLMRGTLRNNLPLTFESTVRAVVSRIDTSDYSAPVSARVDLDDASMASSARFNNDGNLLFVALETAREIVAVDPYSNAEVFRIEVGHAPRDIAVSADGNSIWVHNFLNRTLSVHRIDGISAGVEAEAEVLAEIDLVDDEQLSAEVLLGKQLFHDARDTRLALHNYMSCASCHNEGGHDGRNWDFTNLGGGVRNTVSLRGKGGMNHGRLHWDGALDEVHDFEGQIRALGAGTGLLSTEDFLATQDPVGPVKSGRSADLDALAAYVSSLDSMPVNPFEDSVDAAAAQRGRALFNAQDCTSCHSGAIMTDSGTARLHDVGTHRASSGDALANGVDTPTLLGLWETAPYLHDGRASTVADAIKSHDGFATLSDSDASDLQDYLLSLPAEGDTTTDTASLVSGEAVSGSLVKDQWHHYTFSVEDDATDVSFVLNGLTADHDLYVRAGQAVEGNITDGGEFDASSTSGGTSTERVGLSNNGATLWHVSVHGYAAGDYTLTATQVVDNSGGGDQMLVHEQSQSSEVALRSWHYYRIDTAADATALTVQLSDVSADADLYLRQGNRPSGHTGNDGIYDCESVRGSGFDESCTVSVDGAQSWFVGVYGYTAGSYTITANISATEPPPPEGEDIELNNGEAVQGALAQDEWAWYSFTAPANTERATVDLTELTADQDLYVRLRERPSGHISEGGAYDCGSYVGGTSTEQCSLNIEAGETLYIGVHAYRAGSFTLKATASVDEPPVTTPIAAATPTDGTVALGEWRYYSYTTAANDLQLEFTLDGLSADADLYVRRNALPNGDPSTGANADCVSLNGSTTGESCIVDSEQGQSWLIGVYGYQGSDYTLTVNGSSTRAASRSKDLSVAKGEVLKAAAVTTEQPETAVTTGSGGGTFGLFGLMLLGLLKVGRRR